VGRKNLKYWFTDDEKGERKVFEGKIPKKKIQELVKNLKVLKQKLNQNRIFGKLIKTSQIKVRLPSLAGIILHDYDEVFQDIFQRGTDLKSYVFKYNVDPSDFIKYVIAHYQALSSNRVLQFGFKMIAEGVEKSRFKNFKFGKITGYYKSGDQGLYRELIRILKDYLALINELKSRYDMDENVEIELRIIEKERFI